jgi:hypothetical protein
MDDTILGIPRRADSKKLGVLVFAAWDGVAPKGYVARARCSAFPLGCAVLCCAPYSRVFLSSTLLTLLYLLIFPIFHSSPTPLPLLSHSSPTPLPLLSHPSTNLLFHHTHHTHHTHTTHTPHTPPQKTKTLKPMQSTQLPTRPYKKPKT